MHKMVKAKKLTLSRETIQGLQDSTLRLVPGAATVGATKVCCQESDLCNPTYAPCGP